MKKAKTAPNGKILIGALFPDKIESEKYGKDTLNGRKIFFKILPEDQYIRELSGYNAIKDYYPVPDLLKKTLKDGIGRLDFDYAECVKNNAGLFIDVLNTKKQDKAWKEIITIYKKVFLATIKKIDHSADEIFYKERIDKRLNKFYSRSLWQRYDGKSISLNGHHLTLGPTKIIDEIRLFFMKKLETWGVVSQGDPTDPNFCTQPLFFDYQAGGHNYLTSEFANLFWNNLALGDYFAPVYHSSVFRDHIWIYRFLNEPVRDNDKIIFKPANYRKRILRYYINEVFYPCLKKIACKDKQYNWHKEFKYFIAMRILCIFNLTKMKKTDRLLSICFLQFFFDNEFDNPIEMIDKLWT